MTALGEVMPVGSRRIVLASDLGQNEPPQTSRTLGGAYVLVVQPCDSGNLTRCQQRQVTWRRLLMRDGADDVHFIRPEQASTVVPRFLREGRS